MRLQSVWIIGGSDSSGGAGIQADTATLQDLGVPSCILVSAITAQSHQALYEVLPSSLETLQFQWDAVLQNALPAVIKIGLLCNRAQVIWLANQLKTLPAQPWIILDPVLESSSGGQLAQAGTAKAIYEHLLPRVSLVTPNLSECQILFGTTDTHKVAALLQQNSSSNKIPPQKLLPTTQVLIKGGHALASSKLESIQIESSQVIDSLVGPSINAKLIGRKVAASRVRGTGCTLASAIAAFYVHMLLEQRPPAVCIKEALILAKAYLQQGLDQDFLSQESLSTQEPLLGPCPKTGWPEKPECFPGLEDKPFKRSVDSAINIENNVESNINIKSKLRNKTVLYPIVSSLNGLELCIKNQVDIVQLRLKTGTKTFRLQTIRTAIQMAKNTPTRLFINDEWQWAIEEQAFGVHLGQEDLVTASLTAIREAGVALGVSTHGYWELLSTINFNPSYIAIGSIFPTATKDMRGQIQGLNHLRRLAGICNRFNIPCVAIGGIQLENLSAVLATRVSAVAVVSAITQAKNPAKALQLWLAKLSQTPAFNRVTEAVL